MFINKKNKGKKSRDTVPLRGHYLENLVIHNNIIFVLCILKKYSRRGLLYGIIRKFERVSELGIIKIVLVE
jgi:hypothetical protein